MSLILDSLASEMRPRLAAEAKTRPRSATETQSVHSESDGQEVVGHPNDNEGETLKDECDLRTPSDEQAPAVSQTRGNIIADEVATSQMSASNIPHAAPHKGATEGTVYRETDGARKVTTPSAARKRRPAADSNEARRSSLSYSMRGDLVSALLHTPSAITALTTGRGPCDLCDENHPTLRCHFLYEEDVPSYVQPRIERLSGVRPTIDYWSGSVSPSVSLGWSDDEESINDGEGNKEPLAQMIAERDAEEEDKTNDTCDDGHYQWKTSSMTSPSQPPTCKINEEDSKDKNERISLKKAVVIIEDEGVE